MDYDIKETLLSERRVKDAIFYDVLVKDTQLFSNICKRKINYLCSYGKSKPVSD
jgi:hypothetical protein